MRLSEAWASYESDKRIEGYSRHTIKAYRIQAGLLIRWKGDQAIDSITYDDLKSYLAKDAERLKPSSLGHRVRFLKSLSDGLWTRVTSHGTRPASSRNQSRECGFQRQCQKKTSRPCAKRVCLRSSTLWLRSCIPPAAGSARYTD